jgi:hypothetical protein
MYKRITAFLLLILFTGQLTASFVHFDCNMVCCQEDIVSCCTNEVVEKECSVLGSNCTIVVFLPIVSGPSVQTYIDNELSIIEISFIDIDFEITQMNIVDYFKIHPLAEPPPVFNVPLLI